jgi:hypothetical protein
VCCSGHGCRVVFGLKRRPSQPVLSASQQANGVQRAALHGLWLHPQVFLKDKHSTLYLLVREASTHVLLPPLLHGRATPSPWLHLPRRRPSSPSKEQRPPWPGARRRPSSCVPCRRSSSSSSAARRDSLCSCARFAEQEVPMAGARPCCISPCELGLPPRQPHLAAIFPKCWRMGTLSPLSRKCRARAQLSAPFHVRPWLLSLSAFSSAPATAPQCRHPVKLYKPRSAAPLCSDTELPTPGPLSSGPHSPAAAMAELSGAAPLLSHPQRRCHSCSSKEISPAADCLASRCPSSPSGARRADPASHHLQLAIPL